MRAIVLGILAAAVMASAEEPPLRMAVLDFENQTGLAADARLGGGIQVSTLAAKGLYPLEKALLGQGGIVLLDRRDFIRPITVPTPATGTEAGKTPSFLHAAQMLRADAVLRAKLLSFSTDKRVINQGGYQADYSRLTLRVGLEALDATDGTVIGVADGRAEKDIRLTDADQTVVGEDAALDLLGSAVAAAVAELKRALDAHVVKNRARPRIKLTVATDADPALVEIDGVLVGSTPLEGFEIYQGDHILTVGKSGYRDVSKRILFDADAKVTIPLFRAELTADEIKDILDKARLNAYLGMEPAVIIEKIESRIP